MSFCNILTRRMLTFGNVTDAFFVCQEKATFPLSHIYFVYSSVCQCSIYDFWLWCHDWKILSSQDYFLLTLLWFFYLYLFFFFFVWVASIWPLFWLNCFLPLSLKLFSNSDIINHVLKSFSHWFLTCLSSTKSPPTLESFWSDFYWLICAEGKIHFIFQ